MEGSALFLCRKKHITYSVTSNIIDSIDLDNRKGKLRFKFKTLVMSSQDIIVRYGYPQF